MASTVDSSPPVIKILVLGDAAVGKTSVIRRYVDNVFSSAHQPTVGVDFFLKEIPIDACRGATVHTVRVQLWDIAGQDRSKKVNRVYYKGALGALIVYDISRPETFDSAEKWKKELDNNVTLPNGEALPVVLLGNKVDLEMAAVDVAYVDRYVKKHGFIAWCDVSAKDASNAEFKVSVAWLIQNILCCEELFGPGMRRSAEAFAKRIEERSRVPGSIRLKPGDVKAADAESIEQSKPCCA